MPSSRWARTRSPRLPSQPSGLPGAHVTWGGAVQREVRVRTRASGHRVWSWAALGKSFSTPGLSFLSCKMG